MLTWRVMNTATTAAANILPLTARSDAPAWRILLLLNCFRVLIPMVLGSLFLTLQPAPVGSQQPLLFVFVLSSYEFFALLTFISIKRHWPEIQIQALTQVLTDIIAVSLLTYSSGGIDSGLGALLILPVAAASLIIKPRLGLLLAAIATLGLLLQQGFGVLNLVSDARGLTAAGMLGALMFSLSLGASYATRRLQDSEAVIKQREVDIANLAELNEFIVQHLRESILVVDAQDRVRLINESAAQLLKDGPIATNTLLGEISPRLLYLLDIWRRHEADNHHNTANLVSANGGTLIQPHFVALTTIDPGPTLIFLEDTSIVTERVQQAKLAALGRLSASIAHEVRNPVGAMSHAAQLLLESPGLSTADQRLGHIITSNAERVSTIIENILQLSRRENSHAEALSLNDWVEEFSDQFRQSFQLDTTQLRINHPGYPVGINVDISHLHQILSNLCENALKYGQNAAGKLIEMRYGRISNTNRPYLEIADRGAGISTEQAERIFEPFFTAGEGGTGLGLFIARELAHCNRAVLIYEPRHGGGSTFRIVFSDPQRWEI
ncbi:MAG: PAS domain-containing sensor histidine kinase [Steroidobacteraceae bacterium]